LQLFLVDDPDVVVSVLDLEMRAVFLRIGHRYVLEIIFGLHQFGNWHFRQGLPFALGTVLHIGGLHRTPPVILQFPLAPFLTEICDPIAHRSGVVEIPPCAARTSRQGGLSGRLVLQRVECCVGLIKLALLLLGLHFVNKLLNEGLTLQF